MKYSLVLALAYLCLVSCKNDTPNVVYNPTEPNNTSIKEEIAKDTTLIKVADFPELIDSTAYIVHPIHYKKIAKNEKFLDFSRIESSSSSSYKTRGNSNYTANLLFQHQDSLEMRPLTTNEIRIYTYTLLEKLYKERGLTYFLYNVYDTDTNRNKKLDYLDMQSLYISRVDGTHFQKLNKQNEEVLSHKLLVTLERLYFKTSEDTDKDGYFSDKDKLHYYYVNLRTDHPEAVEYFPVK